MRSKNNSSFFCLYKKIFIYLRKKTLKLKIKMKENFEITSVEDGKKYWISRSVATSAFIFKVKDGQLYVLTEIRGSNMHQLG